MTVLNLQCSVEANACNNIVFTLHIRAARTHLRCLRRYYAYVPGQRNSATYLCAGLIHAYLALRVMRSYKILNEKQMDTAVYIRLRGRACTSDHVT